MKCSFVYCICVFMNIFTFMYIYNKYIQRKVGNING